MKKSNFQCLPKLSEFFEYEIRLTQNDLIQGLIFGFADYFFTYGLHQFYNINQDLIPKHPCGNSLYSFLTKVFQQNQQLSPSDHDIKSLTNYFTQNLVSSPQKLKATKAFSLISNTLAIIIKVNSDSTFLTFGDAVNNKPALFLFRNQNSFFLLYPRSYEYVYCNFRFPIKEKELFHCGCAIPGPYSKKSLSLLYDKGRKCNKCGSEVYDDEIKFIKDFLGRAKICPLCHDQVMVVVCGKCFNFNCAVCSPDGCQNCLLNEFMPGGAIVDSEPIVNVYDQVYPKGPGNNKNIQNVPYHAKTPILANNSNIAYPMNIPVPANNPNFHPNIPNPVYSPPQFVNIPAMNKQLPKDKPDYSSLTPKNPEQNLENTSLVTPPLFLFIDGEKYNIEPSKLGMQLLEKFYNTSEEFKRFYNPSNSAQTWKSFIINNDYQNADQIIGKIVKDSQDNSGSLFKSLLQLTFLVGSSFTILSNSRFLTFGKFDKDYYENVLELHIQSKKLDLIGNRSKDKITRNNVIKFLVRCCGCSFDLYDSSISYIKFEEYFNYECEKHKKKMNSLEKEIAKEFYIKNHKSCILCCSVNVATKSCTKCKAIYCAQNCSKIENGNQEKIINCRICEKKFPQKKKKDKIIMLEPNLEKMIETKSCKHSNAEENGPLKICFICGVIKFEEIRQKACKICGIFPASSKNKCRICQKK